MAPRAQPEDFANGYDFIPPKTAAEVSIDVFIFVRFAMKMRFVSSHLLDVFNSAFFNR